MAVRALNRKLVRDLLRLRGQVIAIAMVVASGIAVLVMSLSALEALQETAEAYYERYRFAHVFAGLKRAPDRLAGRISDIPGVQSVATRIVNFATLDIRGFDEPVIGRLVSIPEKGQPLMNRLALRAGRLVKPGRPFEAVLSEPFAEAHGLAPGDRIKAIMNGRKRTLHVVGIALSPEFVYALAPAALMPDDKRYGVLWMARKTLAAAYDLDGAFNDVSLSLLRGTSAEPVIDRLDNLLARYGGVGAIARSDQISHWFLMDQIEQLETVASILPVIFLAVAAFLTNMVLARLITTERGEIGLMKAFGYSNLDVAWHYAKMVIVITAIGIVLGSVAGAWLGRVNTEIYAEFYRFPLLLFQPNPSVFVIGAVVSLIAALTGTVGAVRRAATLPPAQAMLPPSPALYRRGWMGGTAMARWLDEPTRIILRQIIRWPLRSLLTSMGISLSVGVLIMAMQWTDSIDHIIEVFFFDAQRQDVTVGLVEARSSVVIHEFGRMPGVLAAEPMRIVSADFSAGARRHRGSLTGIPDEAVLQPIYDANGFVVPIPADGLVLATKLAEKLGVGVGDSVLVEIREDRRPVRRIPVVGLFETYIGVPAYVNLDILNRMLRVRPTAGYVNLLVDARKQSLLFSELKDLPEISSVMLRQAAVDAFEETLGETLLIYVSFFVVFAGTLVFGVVYNSARISLSERGRELATLRVLGFSKLEITYILLGEVTLLIVIGLPLGCLAGAGLAWVMTSAFETELYRVPLVIEATTFGSAVMMAIAAALASAELVRRRLNRLDLLAVLKTRE